MDPLNLTPDELLALNLEKILGETPALRYVVPNSIDDYMHKFPGFPSEFYPVLAAAGTPPAQRAHFRQSAGVGLGRRRRRRGGGGGGDKK